MKAKVLVTVIAMSLATASMAQNAQQVIEAARAKAQETAAYREALADPDQSVRLATFEAMIATQNSALIDLAVDTALSSSDRTLRGLALKHSILTRSAVNITLVPAPNIRGNALAEAQNYISEFGNEYALRISDYKLDMTSGTFRSDGSIEGTVSGLVLTFSNTKVRGRLELQDDNTLAGTLFIERMNLPRSLKGGGQFQATARLR